MEPDTDMSEEEDNVSVVEKETSTETLVKRARAAGNIRTARKTNPKSRTSGNSQTMQKRQAEGSPERGKKRKSQSKQATEDKETSSKKL